MSIFTDPTIIAPLLSAVAAIAAAVAAWRVPLATARMADQLRQRSDADMESRRFRLNIFAYIMQGRAEIWSEETVRALNSIDVAFNHSRSVREAWAELYQALNSRPQPTHLVDERVRKLLREMAQDLGLAESLRMDDFGRVYFPTAMLEEREVRALERQATLARLKGTSSPAENTSTSEEVAALWPPKPQ